jgi:hypothetical protein
MSLDGIYIGDKLDYDLCDKIVDVFEDESIINPSTLISGEVEYGGSHNRKDKCLFLDHNNPELANKVNEHLNMVIGKYGELYSTTTYNTLTSVRQKLQKTPIGGGYHSWHCEDFSIETSNRILVWTIYLNDVEEGGETEFLYLNKRVKAEKGVTAIFPANFVATHRGNPPISNNKYILTGWYNILS